MALNTADLHQMTVGRLFLGRAKAFGKRRFIYRPSGESVTYEQAVIKIAALAQEMLSRGIKRGDRIVCYSDMPDPTIYFFLASQFIGAIAAPVSPLFSVGYARRLAKEINSQHFFCAPEIAASLPERQTFHVSDLPPKVSLDFDTCFEVLRQLHAAATSDDVLMLQPTAGSTGAPKLVIRRHSSLLHYATHLNPELDSHPEKAHQYLMLLSFAHSFAYHQFTTAISLGAELAVPWAIDTSVKIEELFALRPSVLALPNRVLKSFVLQSSKLKNESPDIFPGSSEFVVIGGGKGDGPTLRRLVNEGVTPIQIYSTSETSMIAITKKGTWQEESAGKPLPAVDMKIAKDGEILVKSPALMVGYLNNQTANREAFNESGYYQTGDIGKINVAGDLLILGRKKDVFNTPQGSYVYPSRIEQLIESFNEVHQVILVGEDRPYISAMISVYMTGKENSLSTDGLLSPSAHESLYRKFGALLKAVNSELERAEQVVRFYLFSKDFPSSCYEQVQGAKIRRDRREILNTFAGRIAELYRFEIPEQLTCTPATEIKLSRDLTDQLPLNESSVDKLIRTISVDQV